MDEKENENGRKRKKEPNEKKMRHPDEHHYVYIYQAMSNEYAEMNSTLTIAMTFFPFFFLSAAQPSSFI